MCSVVLTGGTKQVRLTVYVDKESARAMNSGDEKLEDILVLHLEGGKDFFISLEFTQSLASYVDTLWTSHVSWKKDYMYLTSP